jgi:hypothetical protein
VYGGSSLTAVFGNQSNYYQPTELLNQIDVKISKIIKMFMPIDKRFDSVEKSLSAIRVDEFNKFKNPFLSQIKEYDILISKKNVIIDSLIASSKEKDKNLIEAKDLISQSQAVNNSSKVLLETDTLIKIEQDNHIVYGFDKSDIANNKNLITVFYRGENDSIILVRKFNRYGFINRSGNLIISFKYEFAENFQNDLALVVQAGKYGFVDKNDILKIPFEYDFALSFKNGRALVSKDNKWFLINTNGKNVGKIRLLYKDMTFISARYLENKNRICLKSKESERYQESEYLVNRKGNYIAHLVFPRKFILFEIESFRQIKEINSSTNYKVQEYDNSFKVVNKRLKAIPNTYSYSADFTFDSNNHAIVYDKIVNVKINSVELHNVKDKTLKYNIINTDGIEILSRQLDYIHHFNFDSYPIFDNWHWGLLDSTFNEKVECKYSYLEQLGKGVTLVAKNGNNAIHTQSGKGVIKIENYKIDQLYGIVDENGFTFIPIFFNKIEFLDNKYFIVYYNGTNSKLELVRYLNKVDAKCLTIDIKDKS